MDSGSGLYEFLKSKARKALSRERRNHTLSPTDLVHEAWPDLAGRSDTQVRRLSWKVFRNRLVDYGRRRRALKNGGGWIRSAEEELTSDCSAEQHKLALEEALGILAENAHENTIAVARLRCLEGYNQEEIAEKLSLSIRAVQSHWQKARVVLMKHLS